MNLIMLVIRTTILHPNLRAGLVIIFSFICSLSQAQEIKVSDTTTPAIYRSYMATVGAGTNLYNGSEYTAYYPSSAGTPFWDTLGFQKGTVGYEGIVYRSVPIAYDLVSNEVLIRDQKQVIIKLDPAKIDFFQVGNHVFIKFNGDDYSKNTLPVDIYDLLYNGSMKVYVKRKKTVSRNANAEGRFAILSYNAYFVYKDSAYYNISGKNDLLKLFRDKDDAIRTFWKQNKLSYKNDPERMITQTVNYYAGLKD
jgi:hypothetical protein